MSERLRVLANADELAKAAAELVAETIVSRRIAWTRLVLAGGSTPRRCYELLSEESSLPWGGVSILFGDERCVPPTDPESNYRMADETLLHRVHPGLVHRIPAELGADDAAKLYEPVVAMAPLDLVLLGIGPDGHTASLFPGHEALNARGLVAAVHDAPKPPPDRVTLTLRALRSARRVVILAAGADKRDAVQKGLAGSVPAGMIAGAEWLVSRDSLAV